MRHATTQTGATNMKNFTAYYTTANTDHRRDIVCGDLDDVTPMFVIRQYHRVGDVDVEHLNQVFDACNRGDLFTSPRDQARIRFFESHTSMSVGDVIRNNRTGQWFAVDNLGYKEITTPGRTLADNIHLQRGA